VFRIFGKKSICYERFTIVITIDEQLRAAAKTSRRIEQGEFVNESGIEILLHNICTANCDGKISRRVSQEANRKNDV